MKLRAEGISWREIDGETVILDLASSVYLKTNETGSTLIRMLTEDRSMKELVDGLITTYGISEEKAKADAASFVEMLGQRKLLEGSSL